MKHFLKFIPFMLPLFIYSFHAQNSSDIPIETFNSNAKDVVNSFMSSVSKNTDNELAAAKAAMPFIHRSEYENYGLSLKQDRLDHSFKKAWQNAKFYELPVKIVRIEQQKTTSVGFGKTLQKGLTYKVFIAKKEDAAGSPAPVNVFVPEDGGEPKIYYYGSL